MLKRTTAAAALLTAPVFVLAACNSNRNAPSSSTPPTTWSQPNPSALNVVLKTSDGRPVANASIDFSDGYATVTVETTGGGILAPGSHGMHIHSVGKCEGDFTSAGGHLQVAGHTGHPASGDLTPLNVRADGSGKVVATTDALTEAALKGPEGSALIIHQSPDNFANIPPRYTHDGAPGPDAETLATGDAGGRVACAVLAPAGSSSSASTSTSTATVTQTTAVPVAPPVTTTTSTSTSTSTTPSSSTTTTTSTTVPTTTTTMSTSPVGPMNPMPGG
ncbi:superoxide dismutase family protein [Mycolicibacterium aubagnense]|uniref:superoxide dismutase family protein n=1 Tax=Mycolicibacterium aubagnense TaxID=319707 RepID=UPI0010FD69A2|nr:superoxide dismutase family protein [Mycolicibacterium aubagnense]TLH69732.1 superoxide dismutase [Mycolicibacterium aubagnense]WGI32495.1 superoxide dismutase family protein [Mycolicibacterium aubagnense]